MRSRLTTAAVVAAAAIEVTEATGVAAVVAVADEDGRTATGQLPSSTSMTKQLSLPWLE